MSDNLNNKLEYIKKKGYIQYISPEAIPFLTEKKIDNFILACEEEEQGILEVKSLPYHIVLEPTNACNLRCPLCPTGLELSDRKKGIAKLDEIKKFLYSIKDTCVHVYLQNWGEPTLHKNICEIVSYCHELGLWSHISTNFSLKYKDGFLRELMKSGLSFIHIDIDGTTQEVYSEYRKRGDLNLVLKNLEEICRIKKEESLTYPKIQISMLAMKQNENQHEEFLKFKKKYNVDNISIDKIQFNPNYDSKFIPENKEYIYSSYDGGKASTRSSTEFSKQKCHWPWSGFVINYDGNISACCIVDDPNSDFGNVYKNDLMKVWNNKNFISARAEFVDRKKITTNTICNICKNETHKKELKRLGSSFAIRK